MDIGALWRGLVQRKAPDSGTTETGPKTDRTRYWANPWVRSNERKGIWSELERMDKDEPMIARGLDFIMRFATTFSDDLFDDDMAIGFRVESPNASELDILAPAIHALQEGSQERVRYAVKFGDAFSEVVADVDTEDVVNHKLFPYSYQLSRNENQFGALLNGNPQKAMALKQHGIAAFEQDDDYGNLIAAFRPYQITQTSFGPKQGLKYAEPLLASVISVCKRLRASEDGLSIARLCRAWPTKVVPVPMPEGIQPDEARDRLRQAAEMMGVETTVPYDADTGAFYIKSATTPESVDTTVFYPLFYTDDGKTIDAEIKNLPADNPNLNALEDLYLLIRKIICALTVPADSLNLSVGQRSFIDKVSPEKREAFLYVARAVQRMERLTVKQVLDIQLLLNGRNPLKAKYRIVQPRINPREAEVAANIDLKRGQTAMMWAKLGIPKDVIGTRALQLAPADLLKWVQSEGTVAPEGQTAENQLSVWSEDAKLQLCAER